jgi:hypothetical protein
MIPTAPTELLISDRPISSEGTATHAGRPNPLDLYHNSLFVTATPLTAPDAQSRLGRSPRTQTMPDDRIALVGDRPSALAPAVQQLHQSQSGLALAERSPSVAKLQWCDPLRRRRKRSSRRNRAGVVFRIAAAS